MAWDEELTLTYRHCALPLAEDLNEIRRIVLEGDIKLIIVDSLGAACGGDMNSAEVATRFFSAIRQLPVTPLLISHVSKEVEKEKTPFGSVYFYNYARNVYQLRKHEEEDEITLGLWHKKCNFTKKNPPYGVHHKIHPRWGDLHQGGHKRYIRGLGNPLPKLQDNRGVEAWPVDGQRHSRGGG